MMRGDELVRRLRRLGRRHGIAVELVEGRGKGSHAKLWYGERATTVKDRRAEIGKGLLLAMCRQLGIRPEDLE